MTEMSLTDLLDPPSTADNRWFQQRGRTFERILVNLLEREHMEPQASMRPSGEEIDGSFAMGDRFFLLEAKWLASPVPASALYAFKGKVDGKLVGTIGAFFSMSDYSTDAVDALLSGKELNLILFGRKDLLLIEQGMMSIAEAVRAKLRYAAEYGQPFLSLESHPSVHVKKDHAAPFFEPIQEWVVVVEGTDDVQPIELLIERFKTQAKVTVFPAGGQLSVASLVQHLKNMGGQNVAAIVTPIADADLQREILNELKASNAEVIALRQPLEDWLGNYVSVDYYNTTMMLTNRNGKNARRYARNLELEKILKANPSFSAFITKLERAPKRA
ncbi:hypothetical protein EJO68_09830 [Variovorax atrisoli]|uniref:hypothetical protein n=1 Tax=Variovorax atrisoli TaxID=3394203 RepID=UPI000F7D6AF5|nr:hypothetical protein [Variovorax sp. 369]RTD94099.1 hypothetical protein EJO68_09830 [Variovorax sp. 369]